MPSVAASGRYMATSSSLLTGTASPSDAPRVRRPWVVLMSPPNGVGNSLLFNGHSLHVVEVFLQRVGEWSVSLSGDHPRSLEVLIHPNR